ncbi:DEAD/DEAH-box helicase (macronuclear) [Tetrahymena thermophila SB210]|uniref:ATP-dependent RNA helicase n=1 Tax=Tetrahymena thermophila (strain SB210) TaxID=312017 RepID=Q233F4_TETTS|nr:DEAD/DEAH-box helicase [Tetrahymena thermophila SB210]EAR91626.1 DEAD/DEAH-box helicase [Tetrahymena thermophila SB210]|eukprot:XP_001011871.1 DEAD/DEAH-box helicase [Tetrahymena thermophila SB210]
MSDQVEEKKDNQSVNTVMTEDIKKEHLRSIETDKTWDDIFALSPEVRERIKQIYERPTKIQYLSIGETIEYIQPVITIKCRNGGGKTLTFAIPALEFAYRNKNKKTSKSQQSVQEVHGQSSQTGATVYCPTSIIIVSTQPLALQIQSVLNNLLVEGVSTEVLFQDQKITQSGQILISTPELLYRYLVIEKLIQLDNLCHIAVDEADNMLTSFQMQLERTIVFLKGRDIVIQFVSATLTEKNIKFIYDALKFDSTQDEDSKILYSIELPWKLKGVTQYGQVLKGNKQENDIEKYMICTQLVNQVIEYNSKNPDLESQIIIFFRKIASILEFESKIAREKLNWKYTTCANKSKRNENIQNFRAGNYDIMLATSVMSRGIDIRKVGLVINFDMPLEMNEKLEYLDKHQYLHNIGRTGRFADLGLSLTFFENDKVYENAKYTIKDSFECDLLDFKMENMIPELASVMKNNTQHQRVQ